MVQIHGETVDRLMARMNLLIVLSGAFLLGVLPLGVSNVVHPFIPFLSIPHLGILGVVAGISAVYFWELTCATRWPRPLSIAAAVTPLIAIAVLGHPPVTDSSALKEYLAIPGWWQSSGAIVPYLWYAPSLYPHLIGLAFLELLSNDLVRLIPLYLALYLLPLAALIGRFVEQRTHRKESAWLAFIFTLTLPIILRATTTPWPDLPAALFIAVALVYLVGWLEKKGGAQLILAGFALALGAGSSCGGILASVATIPAFLFATHARKIPLGRSVGSVLTVGFAALLLFSPWLIRNGIWLSNPFFPLFGKLLGSNALVAGEDWKLSITQGLLTVGAEWRQIAHAPFVIPFTAHDGDLAGYDGMVSPLLVLVFVSLWVYRRHPWVIFFGLLSFMFLLLAYLFEVQPLRSFLPLIFPLTTLTILGLGSIAKLFKRRFERFVGGALIAAHIIFFIVYVVQRGYAMGTFTYRGDTAAYLNERLGDYHIVAAINRHVERAEYVYNLRGVESLFYIEPRVMTGGVEQIGQILGWLRNSASTQILAQEFLNRGIRFLVCDNGQVEAAITAHLSPRELTLWRTFTSVHLVRLFSADSAELYRISARSE